MRVFIELVLSHRENIERSEFFSGRLVRCRPSLVVTLWSLTRITSVKMATHVSRSLYLVY